MPLLDQPPGPDPCASCKARPRAGALLCAACRSWADRLIAGSPGPEILVSGSGPWAEAPLPKPGRRFPGTPAGHEG